MYCLFPELGSSNQLTSARSKHRVLRWWCLWYRRGTSDYRPDQPVQRPCLQHDNLSPWAPPPLSHHWSAHISTTSSQIPLLCQSIVTSVPFFCPSVGGCVLIYAFLAPQEGTMSSAPSRWIPSPSQSTSVGTALWDSQSLNSRMFFVHWYLEGKSIQMQSDVFSITSAAKDIKKESFSPWKGHVVM